MKKQISGLALALSVTSGAAMADGTLALYNWGDYINPDVLTKFTEETGIAVTLDTYSSNEEMLAKIQAGATGYDIVFPSVHMQDVMVTFWKRPTSTRARISRTSTPPSCGPRKTLRANIACPMPGAR